MVNRKSLNAFCWHTRWRECKFDIQKSVTHFFQKTEQNFMR
jgi:hypothetical protein